MKTAFNHIAQQYDTDFTHTNIGRLQRRSVWDYLEKNILRKNKKVLHVLELNCGTGEDALHFARQGHQVWATDISAKMIEVTRHKATINGLINQINPLTLAAQDIVTAFEPNSFDLVFSNFGGLNCLSPKELEQLQKDLSILLKKEGHFLAVIMSNFCLWESAYFLAKRQWKKIFRRWTNKAVMANVGNGKQIATYYYSPRQFGQHFKEKFNIKKIQAVGLTVPPSYLENFFRKRSNWLQILGKVENKLKNLSFLGAISDHYLIDLSK